MPRTSPAPNTTKSVRNVHTDASVMYGVGDLLLQEGEVPRPKVNFIKTSL